MREHIGIIEISDELLQITFPDFYQRLKAERDKYQHVNDPALHKEIHDLLLLPESYTVFYIFTDFSVSSVWSIKVSSDEIPPTDTSDPSARYPRVTPIYETVEDVPRLRSIAFSQHTEQVSNSPDGEHDTPVVSERDQTAIDASPQTVTLSQEDYTALLAIVETIATTGMIYYHKEFECIFCAGHVDWDEPLPDHFKHEEKCTIQQARALVAKLIPKQEEK